MDQTRERCFQLADGGIAHALLGIPDYNALCELLAGEILGERVTSRQFPALNVAVSELV